MVLQVEYLAVGGWSLLASPVSLCFLLGESLAAYSGNRALRCIMTIQVNSPYLVVHEGLRARCLANPLMCT